jgi:hypothetical protein
MEHIVDNGAEQRPVIKRSRVTLLAERVTKEQMREALKTRNLYLTGDIEPDITITTDKLRRRYIETRGGIDRYICDVLGAIADVRFDRLEMRFRSGNHTIQPGNGRVRVRDFLCNFASGDPDRLPYEIRISYLPIGASTQTGPWLAL